MPAATASLPFDARYSDAEFEMIALGCVPEAMEDKWFIVEHEGTVAFHRSWTGTCIYLVRFDRVDGARRAVDAVVNRDPAQYGPGNHDPEYEIRLLHFLIDNLLLGRHGPFPLPGGVSEIIAGVFQHHVAGTGYRTERGKK